jgi:hypothetical protein
VAILYTGNITTKQARSFFDVALGELLFLAHLAEAVTNNHGALLHPHMDRASTWNERAWFFTRDEAASVCPVTRNQDLAVWPSRISRVCLLLNAGLDSMANDGYLLNSWSHHLPLQCPGKTGRRMRVRLRDHKVERVADLKNFRQAGFYNVWLSLAPDDSPLLLRDTGTQEIYALDWQVPY